MTAKKRLRIALMVNDEGLTQWQFAMLEKVEQGDFADIVLAIIRDNHNQAEKYPRKRNIVKSLFYKYSYWDRNYFHLRADALTDQSINNLSSSVERITIRPITSTWSDRFSEYDLAVLKEYNLDIIIRLGWRIIRGDVLRLPRYGIWSYHHGDNRMIRGGPPGVWELFKKQECTGLTLQILSESLDGGQVLSRSNTSTDPCSISRTKNRIYWRSVLLLPRELKKLQKMGSDNYFKQVTKNYNDITFYSHQIYSENNLNLLQLVELIGRNILAYIKEAYFAKRFEEKWVLYFRINNYFSTALWRFHKLEPPNDRYWADPHVLHRNDRYYVFVEEFIYATNLGRISVIEIDKHGNTSDSVPILETGYHLSYPYVFEHDGRTFMIPETGSNKSIELYECIDFPLRWEFVKNIMHGTKSVDTTLLRQNDRWWIFTSLSETPDNNTHDELSLFSSDDLFSDDWQPHPQNAVVSDVRYARSAGAILHINGKIIRPTQDCSRGYGYALSLREITTLDEHNYEEKHVSYLTPDWTPDVHGVHTIAYTNGLTIVDAKLLKKKSTIDYQGLSVKPCNSSRP